MCRTCTKFAKSTGRPYVDFHYDPITEEDVTEFVRWQYARALHPKRLKYLRQWRKSRKKTTGQSPKQVLV